MLKKILTISIYLLMFFGLQANQPDALFTSGNQFYQAGQYHKAVQQYESILEADYSSVDVYFNLGNSYLKLEELGKAILNYERALLIDPFNKDVDFNLSIAREKQRDEISDIPEFFLREWWNNLSMALPMTAWAIIGILLWWLGIMGLIMWQRAKSRQQRKKGFVGGLALSFLGILPLLLALNRNQLQHHSNFAIQIDKESRFQSAPDEDSKTIAKMHEGLKVEVLDEIGEWYKVKLGNGDQGWLPKQSLIKL